MKFEKRDLVVAVVALAVAYTCWGGDTRRDVVADLHYDSLVVQVKRLRADSVVSTRRDSVSQGVIVRLTARLDTSRVRQRLDSARVDTVTAALKLAVADSGVSRDSLAVLVDSLEARHAADVATWRRIAATNDSLYHVEKARREDRDRQLHEVRASLASALGQVERERARAKPGLLKRIARDAPWYVVVHLAGRAHVP